MHDQIIFKPIIEIRYFYRTQSNIKLFLIMFITSRKLKRYNEYIKKRTRVHRVSHDLFISLFAKTIKNYNLNKLKKCSQKINSIYVLMH